MKEGGADRPAKPLQRTSGSASAKGSSSMERFLLFIPDEGRNDIATIHLDEASARADFATYIHQQTGGPVPGNPTDDDDAVRAYLANGTGMNVVARVASLAR